jgi:hypothetical protein
MRQIKLLNLFLTRVFVYESINRLASIPIFYSCAYDYTYTKGGGPRGIEEREKVISTTQPDIKY